ncbi:MAG: arginine deiminase-related protein [Pedococcus sp.]
MSVQAPSSVVLIRPHHFTPNPDTAGDNAFQSLDPSRTPARVAADAYDEVTAAAQALTAAGVRVHLFDDVEATRPDSVFPNNWFSTHAGGRIAIYPMYSPSRRAERRTDILEMLKAHYRVQELVDYSGLEHDRAYLEGTGAMVLDHVSRVAYVARSNRADPLVLQRFCAQFGYEPMVFDAADEAGISIYHTNVMMTIATSFVLVGLELIDDAARRAEVARALAGPGRDIVALSAAQVRDFAGNALELATPTGRVLVLSARAERSLTWAQRATIERSCRILALEVPTIELAGGSVRCMLAGIFLTPRPVYASVSQEPVLMA